MKTFKLAGAGMDFGLTNDKKRLRAAQQFRIDALADGWVEELPLHSKEPLEQYSHLSRSTGWKMHIMARILKDGSNFKYQVSVDVWAPDKLVVRAPMVYCRKTLRQMVKHCNLCDAEGVETTRYSFAGRCCLKCSKTPEANGFYTG